MRVSHPDEGHGFTGCGKTRDRAGERYLRG